MLELNKIVTSSEQIGSVQNIVTPTIQKIIQFLILIESPYTVTVHDLDGNVSLTINHNNTSVKTYAKLYGMFMVFGSTIKRFVVNGVPLINHHFMNHKFGYPLKQTFDVFRQTNQQTIHHVYPMIDQLLNGGSILTTIGGECYVFTKMLFNRFESFKVFSDYKDIIDHALINLTVEKDIKPIEISLVDYNNEFIDLGKTDSLILNVRSLLPCHINTVSRYRLNHVIIISCNKKNIKRIQNIGFDCQVIHISYNVDIIWIKKMKKIDL